MTDKISQLTKERQ